MGLTVLHDLRPMFGPARDQNPRPTCMAFAASDAHAAARGLPFDPLSAEWAYYHAVRRDGGGPDDGATLGSMLDALRFDGQPIEAAWPYSNGPSPNPAAWAPPAGVAALFRRDSAGPSPGALANIAAAVSAGSPVLLVMTISDAFYMPDERGVVAAAEPPDPERVHAVVAVGHARLDDGAAALLVRNSWGELWGSDGHAWLHEAYLSPRLLGCATMKEEIA